VAEPGRQASADCLPSRHSTGIGIHNTRERLRNRYGDQAKLVAGPVNDGYQAIIRLPFVASCAS